MQGADNLIFPVADHESLSQITNPWAHLVAQNSGAGTQAASTKASLGKDLRRFKLYIGYQQLW